MSLRSITLAGAVVAALALPAAAQSPPAKPDEKKEIKEGLDREKAFGEAARRLQQLEAELGQATEWVQKAILCVELGDLQDRRAIPALVRALGDDELMVQAFALHALARLPDAELKGGGGVPLAEGLIGVLKARGLFHRRVSRALLTKLAGEDLGDSPSKWKSWLKRNAGALTVMPPPAPFDPSKHDPALVAEVQKERSEGGTSVRPRIPPVASEIRELNKNGIDVVFCLDQTSSMTEVLTEAKSKLQLLTTLVGLVVKDNRFGLISYDDAIKVTEPLTADIAALGATLERVKAEGGGDIPEGVDKALDAACKADIGWRRKAVKTVIIVGDAPPRAADHPAAMQRATSMKSELKIVVNAVSTGPQAVRELTELATAGGGRSLLLGEPQRLVSEVLLLIFGETLRPAMERFAPVLLEIHEEERGARAGGR